MQEEKEKMVDIDTSGPGADIELPEEKQEDVVETKEDSSPSTPEPTSEKVEASDEKPEEVHCACFVFLGYGPDPLDPRNGK